MLLVNRKHDIVVDMKRADTKSHCPVNFALETFGDKWSLLIVRDIVFYGKHTYGEFLKSEEGIATNILADRLSLLESKNILIKSLHPTDKRKDIYHLSEKGLDLIPVLLQLEGWSAKYDPKTNASKDLVARLHADFPGVIRECRRAVSAGQPALC